MTVMTLMGIEYWKLKKNEQENVGWGVGLGMLAGVLALALALFLLGIKRYRREGPTGSPFTRMAQVFVAAARKWRVRDTPGHDNFCYTEEEHDEPHNLHVQPRYHTLLHTHHCRWVPLYSFYLLELIHVGKLKAMLLRPFHFNTN